MSTQNGLVQYDGFDFRTFTAVKDDRSGLTPSGRSYHRLIQGRDGIIWVGTYSFAFEKSFNHPQFLQFVGILAVSEKVHLP
jgi:hypothetical protein